MEKLFCRFGDMVALQKNNTLNDKLEYVAFTLIFILFGLAVVAASLDLLVLRFVTMNTEDERRDEAEALQVKTKNHNYKRLTRLEKDKSNVHIVKAVQCGRAKVDVIGFVIWSAIRGENKNKNNNDPLRLHQLQQPTPSMYSLLCEIAASAATTITFLIIYPIKTGQNNNITISTARVGGMGG